MAARKKFVAPSHGAVVYAQRIACPNCARFGAYHKGTWNATTRPIAGFIENWECAPDGMKFTSTGEIVKR